MTIRNKSSKDIEITTILQPGDAITRKNSSEAFKNKMIKEQGRGVDERGPFVMAKSENLMELEKLRDNQKLTVTDRRYLMILLLLADFNHFDKEKTPLISKGKKLSKEMAADIWGVAEETAKKKLNRLVKADILLTEVDETDKRRKFYYLNKQYFIKGIHKNRDEKFVKVFQNKLKEIIQNVSMLKHKRLKNKSIKKHINYDDVIGLLQAVIPYFHFETYYLVKNPDEKITLEGEPVLEALERNKKALKHLSLAHLCRISGLGDNETVKSYFEFLQEVGAVMITKTKGKIRYRIHPDLLFRLDGNGMDDYTKHVRSDFSQHDE
ncbi:hypothetical protein SAMN05880501_101145 [Ureibacillus xyleni]|uniref:Uncharacterized protein n=1 Tax=Ureibacillus xyleni TaxID=614648 RepID=A0A285R8Y0_9BACL|nr:hypothetical protein [Ureibacillus xyleni]SOB90344.1 hypothetical protein SAMN05880501_101145 [Ureibacillus xyleni]